MADFKNKADMAGYLEIDEAILKEGGTGIRAPCLYGVFSDAIKSKGRDGVVTRFGEIAVFDATQIKSATGNSGAFDGANPNIYMQGNKSASQVIADTIAKQVADTGKYDADYAQAAGELAAAYYKATAAAMGKTSKDVFDAVGLDVTAGEVKSGANAQISFGDKRHSMVLGEKANASSHCA